MTTYRVATIPGDGVGPEVVDAARRVVDATGRRFGFQIDWTEVLAGGIAIDTYGVAMRPEDVEVTTNEDGLELIVDVVEELGADAYIYGQTKAALVDSEATDEEVTAKPFIARVDGRRPPEKGQTIYLKPRQGHLHMFNAESGERIGD